MDCPSASPRAGEGHNEFTLRSDVTYTTSTNQLIVIIKINKKKKKSTLICFFLHVHHSLFLSSSLLFSEPMVKTLTKHSFENNLSTFLKTFSVPALENT